MASPAQKRAQRDLAAFVAVHGRRPRKGERVKGYSGGASARAAPRSSPKPSDDVSAARRRAARKAAKTRSKPWWKVKNWVKNNPGKATLAALGAGGGTALALSETARETAKGAVGSTVAFVQGKH